MTQLPRHPRANTAITPSEKGTGRIDIAAIRREQIIEAAVGIITSQGLHNLSLSKIENATHMKRGQLTYYFPTKEDILLAVFDRMLLLLCEQLKANGGPPVGERHGLPGVWECVQQMLRMVLEGHPGSPQFHTLQFTFLAQMAHREDFRERLASLYREWREGLAAHWFVSGRPALAVFRAIAPKTVASYVQALMHGLTVQLAADPEAFDRQEMLQLCIATLAPLFLDPSASMTAPLWEEPPMTQEKPQ